MEPQNHAPFAQAPADCPLATMGTRGATGAQGAQGKQKQPGQHSIDWRQSAGHSFLADSCTC